MIVASGLNKHYKDLHVLKNVSLSIQPKEVISIAGPSGAGKSTLLHILGTIDRPDSGTLDINGQNTLQLKGKKLSAFRNQHIGFIFQFHHLLPEFNAIENISMPALIARKPSEETDRKARQLLDVMGLKERATHKPSAMSGGEQQRVAVARALINDPAVVLADEPTGNLDSQNAIDMHDLFFRLRDELGQTFVIVTHNEELADRADRRINMKDGQLA